MTDDVKAANAALVESMVRQLRGCVSVGDEMMFDVCFIDDAEAWLAGEPARRAAAVAAAREEQARVDMDACNDALAHDSSWTPSLTATPLADRIAELEKANNAFRNKQSLWDEDASFYLQTLRQADSIGALKADLHDEREVSQSLREQLIAAEARIAELECERDGAKP